MSLSITRALALLGTLLALCLPPVPTFAQNAEDVPEAGMDADEDTQDEEEGDEENDALSANDVPAPPEPGEFPSQELSSETLQEFLLAEIAAARSQFDLSARTYLALARKTRDPRIAHRAAYIAYRTKDNALTAEAAKLWVEIAPESKEAQQFLAYVQQGHNPTLNKAQQVLAAALARDLAKLPANLLGLNRALAKAENKDAVRSTIYRLTEPYLTHPEAHFARAQATLIAGRPMEATGALDRALELRPNWLPALLLKTHILVETDSADKACQMLATVLARDPNNQELRLAYARSLIAANKLAEARAQFSILLAAAPNDRNLLYTVAMLSAEIGDAATAEPLLKKALAGGHPQADIIRLQLGKLAANRGNYPAARQWFNAVTPGGYSAEARIRSAQTFAKEGKLDQARKLLQTAPNPETRRRYLLAESLILTESGQAQQAFNLIDQALRAQPDDNELLYESAMLADRTGRHDVMETRLRKLIALSPEHAHAYNALGYSLADRGLRLDEAEKFITRALELLPKDPYITDSMGWVRFRRGDLPGALERLRQAYALRTDPEIAAHLGEVLWRMNRNDEARSILNKAISDNPSNTSLKSTIQRLYSNSEKKR
ncbi:MAG: tetratricopeptide repeat protein [Azoarcus sp.]|jgi:tetratricopeptide (TPR) repeat protein|nr:tetratricopeptide repeat protein [Azoarcus sp.]